MSRRALIGVFLLALSLRLGHLALAYEGPESLRTPDAQGYERYAAWLAGELPSSQRPDALMARRTPGYPAYLALFRLTLGPDPLWPVMSQCLLGAALCSWLAALAARLDPRLGTTTGVLAALGINRIAASSLLLTETVFLLPWLAALAAALAYLRRPAWPLAALGGVALGGAALVRAAALYLPLLPLAALLVAGWRGAGRGRALAHAAVMLAAFGAVLAPRLVDHHRRHGVAEFTTMRAIATFRHQAPTARAWVHGSSLEREREELERRLAEHLSARGLAELPDDPFAAASLQEEVGRAALRELGPLGLAQAVAVPTALNLLAPSLLALPGIRDLPRPAIEHVVGEGPLGKLAAFTRATLGSSFLTWTVLGGLATLLLRALELMGWLRLVRGRGRRAAGAWLLLATGGYFLLITGALQNVRYRIPVEPALCIFLASGVVGLRDRIASQRPGVPAG